MRPRWVGSKTANAKSGTGCREGCGWCRFRFRFKFIAGTKGYAITYIVQ